MSQDKLLKRILMCYGKTPYTPGRFLEDGLRGIGAEVDVFEHSVDFGAIDLNAYSAVLFIESPARPPVDVANIDRVRVPKLFWIHHGENRLETNKHLCDRYRPDILLMAHSLSLSRYFPTPARFFPFGVAKDLYYSTRPLRERHYDISFVGSEEEPYYSERNSALSALYERFDQRRNLCLHSKMFLGDLARLYGDTRIVYNQTADRLKTLNMRIFEGMGCGALILTDHAPEQDLLFQDGVHYVIYQDLQDALEKAEYYMTHVTEAQTIAHTGQQYLFEHHTYYHRAREIINVIQNLL